MCKLLKAFKTFDFLYAVIGKIYKLKFFQEFQLLYVSYEINREIQILKFYTFLQALQIIYFVAASIQVYQGSTLTNIPEVGDASILKINREDYPKIEFL